MSIKKNVFYNSILTTSSLLFPLLTYPYISRVLGVSNIGTVNFIDSVVNYFLLFSMMGIAFTGIRETAINKDNQEKLNRSFSSLFFLNTVFTIIAIAILFCAVIFVPKLWEYKELMYVGAFKLLFNLFLIEWFFRGIEKFKYITLTTLFIKVVYVILVFSFVKKASDYNVYYALTVGIIVVNSFFNWFYSKRFVKLKYKYVTIKPYLSSFFNYGLYGLLTSMYTSFNVVYLGFTSGEIEVGYYTTATKLYGILIALFSAFTAVMLPRMSSLVGENNNAEMNRLIDLSFEILLIFCLPVLIIAEFYAPQIILLLSGPGYEGAITPMRILIPLLLIIGIEQILIIQILMPLKKDKEVLINSSIGAFVGIISNIILVKYYGSIGSSIVWVLSELSILTMAIYFVNKTKLFVFKFNLFFKYSVASIPYIVICLLVWNINNAILQICILVTLSLVYFCCYHMLFNKTIILVSLYKGFRNSIIRK